MFNTVLLDAISVQKLQHLARNLTGTHDYPQPQIRVIHLFLAPSQWRRYARMSQVKNTLPKVTLMHWLFFGFFFSSRLCRHLERKVGVSLWMKYCIVQVQSGRPLWGSVCKVIWQSPQWFTEALTHHRHDTGLHQCCGCSEKKQHNIYLHRK